MTDTPENQPIEAAEILKLLQSIDAQTRANGEQLSALAEQMGDLWCKSDAHGSALSRARTVLDDLQTKAGNHSSALRSARTILDEIQTVVRDAAPLLNSRPARALRSGGNVLDYIKGGRSGG